MKAKKICSSKELVKVIAFLKIGFPRHKKELDKLSSHIQISNEELGFYGFVHFDDKDKIDGAILTPLQCREDGKLILKPVINLSSWYMLKKSRGIKVINFAKFFLNELRSFYITNYSANKEAYLLFKFFGFKDLLTTQICSSLLIVLSVNPLKAGINKKLSNQLVIKKYKEISSFSLTKEIEFYEFTYKNQSFIYSLRKRKSLIPTFFNLKLKIPILDIIWCSNENCLSKNWKLFCKTIFLQQFNLGVYCNFRKDNFPNFNSFDYLINTKSFNKTFLISGIEDQRFIYTIGSEKMIF